MSYSLVYVTTSHADEAKQLARYVLQQRLVACANILPSVQSLFWWQGEIQESAESVLLMKTRTTHVQTLIAEITKKHSYACPCVVAWPIGSGNPAFLQWINQEVL